MLLKLIFY